MTCCGGMIEITSHDDLEPRYLCTECGRQGGQDEFPDPLPDPPAPLGWRDRLAMFLYRLADRISQ